MLNRFPELSGLKSAHVFEDPASYHRHLQTVFPRPHLFAIITWGCCASTWLAKVLNGHPEIFCQHAFNQHYTCALNQSVDDGIAYLESIAVTAHAYRVAGDIHGMSRDMIGTLRERFGDTFSSAVLVRDPKTRLLSMLSDMRIIRGGYSDYRYTDDLLEKIGIDPSSASMGQRLFVHSVNMLNAIVPEMQHCQNVFKMEAVTSSPERLFELVSHISGGTIDIERKWLESNISSTAVNSHRNKIGSSGEFTAEERTIIKKIISEDAVSAYADLGYNVRFFE